MKDKSTVLALCCFGFIGIGGLHDFYLGNIVKGIIKLFTCNWFFIGTVIDLINIDKNQYSSNIKFETKIKKETNISNLNIELPIVSYDYNVAGITYENRQEIIKRMIKRAIREEFIEAYDNMTNKEIIDYGDTVFEANNILFDNIELIPVKFDGTDAIEIYIEDICDANKKHMIGYVPKNQIKNTTNFLEQKNMHPEYKVIQEAYLTGGKGKIVRDERIESIEFNYGINVSLALYKQ